jgi:hypothetical protein
MKRALIVAVLLALAAVACSHAHEDWPTLTGSAMPNQQPLPFMSNAIKPGQFPVPQGFQLSGCLSGSDERFILTDGNTGTIYRLLGDEHAVDPSEPFKLHTGETVALAGAVAPPYLAGGPRDQSAGDGVPRFRVSRIQTLGLNCPAIAQGGINELNVPPAEKLGLKEAEVMQNPENQPGQPAKGASVTK